MSNTDLKHSIVVLTEFFEQFDQTLLSINLKLSERGQIEYATGTLTPGIGNRQEAAEKCYRKKLVSKDYRFCNTVLDFEGVDKFIITSR